MKEVEERLTPLMFAASEGHVEVVTELVRLAAKVDKKNRGGLTALHLAAIGGKKRTMKALVEMSKSRRSG